MALAATQRWVLLRSTARRCRGSRLESGRDFYVIHATGWHGNRRSVLSHAFQVKLDGFADRLLCVLGSLTGGHAPRKIENIGGVVAFSLLNDYGVSHGIHLVGLRPDCLRILFKVRGAKSSLGLPAKVTRPGFTGCLYWR